MKKAALFAALLALSFGAQAGAQLGDMHVKAGVKCEVCHGPDMKNPEYPTIETCTKCHNTKDLVAKTKDVKPTNPHTSPHYADQLDCTNCHMMHEESQNFCAQCHNFNFKVP